MLRSTSAAIAATVFILGLAWPEPAAAEPADNRFALGLYQRLASESGNLFLSPFSVSSALAMTAEGARGETAEQMAAVLGGKPAELRERLGAITKRLNEPNKPYEAAVANALWVEQSFPLRPGYVEPIEKNYGAGVFNVDFKSAPEPARERINGWVEKQTRDRIKNLIPAGIVTPNTRLVLTNAIYFKGDWVMPFKSDATQPEDFTLADGEKMKAPMMRHPKLPARFADLEGVKLLELFYRGNDLTMLILLPDGHDGLAALEKSLSPEKLVEYAAALRPMKVDTRLPKFKLEQSLTLNSTLAAMGMPAAFAPGKADFAGMSDSPEASSLMISAVVHKAFVDVNEKGTEAAAATGVVAGVTSVQIEKEPPVFRADHPFLFMIRERSTGAILFMGRVAKP